MVLLDDAQSVALKGTSPEVPLALVGGLGDGSGCARPECSGCGKDGYGRTMRIDRRSLRPHTVDPLARGHAKRLADDWRAAGLEVDLVEYVDTATDPGGYVLTGRSHTSVMSCRCQSWLYRRWFWGGRQLWTIVVAVRTGQVDPTEIADPLSAPARQAGFAAAWEHEQAWAQVQEWIDGAAPLPPTLDAALAAMS